MNLNLDFFKPKSADWYSETFMVCILCILQIIANSFREIFKSLRKQHVLRQT